MRSCFAILCIGLVLVAVFVPLMSTKSGRHMILYAALEIGALSGVPMTPEKIEQIMQATKRVRIERVVEQSDGDPPQA